MGKFPMIWSRETYGVIHKMCESICGDEFDTHVQVNPYQHHIADVTIYQKHRGVEFGLFHIHLPEFESLNDDERNFLLDMKINDIREAIQNADV